MTDVKTLVKLKVEGVNTLHLNRLGKRSKPSAKKILNTLSRSSLWLRLTPLVDIRRRGLVV